MNKHYLRLLLLLCPVFLLDSCACGGGPKGETIEIIKKVNGRWQAAHPDPGNAFWHPAAYHIGNLAAWQATGEESYKLYTLGWAENNEWKGAKSDNRAEWKYSYGEKDDYVLFGDWQTCFQVYADLYKAEGSKDPGKIARATEVMEYQMSTPADDYWWWADGLFMVMPVMVKLHSATGNGLYLEKLYEYFSFARDLMYDGESALFYRDAKYIYPQHATRSGMKDFWARGNGWVFAALAKVLEELPGDDAHKAEYEAMYRSMAEAIAASQQPEGYWTRSMLDPEQAPGPETSGTAFFAYGFLWGMNNGYLDAGQYGTVVDKSWKYLTEFALQEDGTVGYVQPIGERAIPGQTIDAHSTADFGVGAFLLAASEMVKRLEK